MVDDGLATDDIIQAAGDDKSCYTERWWSKILDTPLN
jgi:hypothetical protein